MEYDLLDKRRSLTAALGKAVRHSGKPYGPDKYRD